MLYLHSTNEIRVCVNDFLLFLCSLKLRILLAEKNVGGIFFCHPQYPTHNLLRHQQKMQFCHLTHIQLRTLPMRRIFAMNCFFREIRTTKVNIDIGLTNKRKVHGKYL